MLTVRPVDPAAIEKQLANPAAPVILVSVSTIDPVDADEFLPGERLQQEEAPARRDRQERPADVPLDAPSIQSDVRVTPFALAFVGLLCAMFIGFVWEIGPHKLDSPEYGYDEALGTETSYLSRANFLSNCPDDNPATAGGIEGQLGQARGKRDRTRRGVSNCQLHANGIGGNRAE